MKTVIYSGQVFDKIPDWANYIAADQDGEVWAFEDEPAYFVDNEGAHYQVVPNLTGHNRYDFVGRLSYHYPVLEV